MTYLENDNPRIEKLRMLKQVWGDFYVYGEVDDGYRPKLKGVTHQSYSQSRYLAKIYSDYELDSSNKKKHQYECLSCRDITKTHLFLYGLDCEFYCYDCHRETKHKRIEANT